MQKGVSIILCCYNSSGRLPVTLDYAVNQNVTGINWEIVVVDNASTDDTAGTAQKILSAKPGCDYTVVKQPEPGLSNARSMGYRTAKYEYLLFCDDDNWLAADYVQLCYNTMESNFKIGVLGGCGEAVFEATEPVWFKQYASNFAVGDQSASPDMLSRVNEAYGAGLTIRKTYLDELYNSGFKSVLSDRVGTQLISGGDMELCYMAKFFEYEVWYHRGLKFKHLMPAGRMNWPYLKKLYFGFGRTNVYTYAYKYVEKYGRIPGENLKLPFWLDTFIHRLKVAIRFYPKVIFKMNKEGDPDVLRFIAIKGEIGEIWSLKEKYLQVYKSIYANLNLKVNRGQEK